ncbi:MAG: DUF58 domain-containing protein [Nitrospirae bacterium]|nr:DUF58 domain-containing protein [Candidatus Manganitrophaceae bacterium]
MVSRLTLFNYFPRTLRPTREGGYFLILTLGIGVAAVNTGNNLLYLLVAFMLSLIIVSGLLSEQSLRKLALSAIHPAATAVGMPVSIWVQLRNEKKRLPSFSLRIDPVPAPEVSDRIYLSEGARFGCIAPRSAESQPLRITFSKRGCYRLEGVTLSTTFPFGFFIKTAARREPMALWVYPRLRPIASPVRPASFGIASAFSSHQTGQGAAFHQFRAYQQGDDCRLIHWKLSARQGRWILKERERDARGVDVLLLLNNVAPPAHAEGWEDRFERGVETIASLAAEMIRTGMTVSVQTADQEIEAGAGPAHLDRMLRVFSLIQPLPLGTAPLRTVDPDGRPVVFIQWHPESRGLEIPSEATVIDSEEERSNDVH